MATSASSESESKRDKFVNISEGTENREETTEIELAVQENSHRTGVCYETHLTMDPSLDQTPPPPYQENNHFHQCPPSAPTHPFPPSNLPSLIYPSLPSRSSPPPAYSQIDLSNYHFPSATPLHLPSQLGGPSPHLPSQLVPGAPAPHLPSQLGGARRQTLQQTNQRQLTNKEMTAALRRAGVTNGQRIVNVRLKEEEQQEEEMNSMRKGGVAVGIFVLMFFVIYLCLPYTDFSPWD